MGCANTAPGRRWWRIRESLCGRVYTTPTSKTGATGAKTARVDHSWAPVGDVVHFDFLFFGESKVEAGTDCRNEYEDNLVLGDDVSEYSCLAPANEWAANFAAESLLQWCVTVGASSVLVSDNATYCRKRLLRRVAVALGIIRRF